MPKLIDLQFVLMQICVELAYLIIGYKFNVTPEMKIPMKVVE